MIYLERVTMNCYQVYILDGFGNTRYFKRFDTFILAESYADFLVEHTNCKRAN